MRTISRIAIAVVAAVMAITSFSSANDWKVIYEGQNATINWSVANAPTCTPDTDYTAGPVYTQWRGAGDKPSSGSLSLGGFSSTGGWYTFSCTYGPTGATDAAYIMVCPTGTLWDASAEICQAPILDYLTGTSCTIPANETTCDTNASWNILHPLTPKVYLDGDPAWSWNTASGNNNHTFNAVEPGSHTYTAWDGRVLQTVTVTQTCVSGTTWKDGVCKLPPSGTVSVSPASCTIALDASSCSSTVTWTVSNPTGGTAVLTDSRDLTRQTSGTGGNFPESLSSGTRTFYVRDGSASGTILAQATMTAACASGSTWNETKCDPNQPTVDMTATPSGLNTGENLTSLGYTSTNATHCSLSVNGIVRNADAPLSDSWSQYGPLTTTQTFAVTCDNGGYKPTTDTVVVTVCPADKYWDATSGTCLKRPPKLTQLDTAGCTIPVGSSNCNTTAKWNIQFSVQPRVYRDGVFADSWNQATGDVTHAFTVGPGDHTYTAWDGTILQTNTVTKACATGTGWLNGKCVAPSGPTDPPTVCPDGSTPVNDLCPVDVVDPSTCPDGSTPVNGMCPMDPPCSDGFPRNADGTCNREPTGCMVDLTCPPPSTYCPYGYVLSADGTSCILLDTECPYGYQKNGYDVCEPIPVCTDGYPQNADGTCNRPVPVSGAVTAAGCTILEGENNCQMRIQWQILYAAAPMVYINGDKNNAWHAASGFRMTGITTGPGTHTFTAYDENSGVTLNTATATKVCEANTVWNGSVCAPASGQMTAPYPFCEIAVNGTSCGGYVNYTTQNTTQASIWEGTVRKTIGTSGSMAVLGITPVGKTYNLRNGSVSSGLLLNTITVTAVCAPDSGWNGTKCAPVSGDVSASPLTCSIPAGSTVCSTNITFTTQNTIEATVWADGSVFLGGTSGSGTYYNVPRGTKTLELRNGKMPTGTLLDSVAVTGSCARGTVWDGSACVAAAGTLSVSPNSCFIPLGETYCSSTITFTAANTDNAKVFAEGDTTPLMSGLSGTADYSNISFGGKRFILNNAASDGDTTQLAEATVVGSCGGVNEWENGNSMCIGPTPIVEVEYSPRGVAYNGALSISWSIKYPNTTCKLEAELSKPGTCNAACQADVAATEAALNAELSSGMTNQNDPNGKRGMRSALTGEVTTDYAKGIKTVNLQYSTEFSLTCDPGSTRTGTQPRASKPIKTIIYVTEQNEG